MQGTSRAKSVGENAESYSSRKIAARHCLYTTYGIPSSLTHLESRQRRRIARLVVSSAGTWV
jgi:hypothetical protein